MAAPDSSTSRTSELGPPTPEAPAPLRAVHTTNFPALLRQFGASLLVTTYQAGKLVIVRDEGDHLNAHFRVFHAPMGLALDGGRLAIGTMIQVWEYVDVPAVAARLDPPGRHDACFLPRASHVTGNIQGHEMAWGADGALWVVNTRFSCLCTLDRSASFAPHWRPPFVSRTGADRPLPPQRPGDGGRPPALRHGAGRDRRAGRLAGEQGRGRHRDGRRLGRGDRPRVVDAPLAAVVRRPALGLRVGRGDARLHRPENRQVRADRRGAGLHTGAIRRVEAEEKKKTGSSVRFPTCIGFSDVVVGSAARSVSLGRRAG